MKNLIKENYYYITHPTSVIYEIGETITVSNFVKKGEFNIAGKPVIIRLLKQENSKGNEFQQVWRQIKQSNENLLSRNYSVSNRQERLGEISQRLFKSEYIQTNYQLTDIYGNANFSFILSNEGDYTAAVFYLNSQDFFSEHLNLISFSVIDRERVNRLFLLPFGLILLLGLGVILKALFFPKTRMKAFGWPERLLVPSTLLIFKVKPSERLTLKQVISFAIYHGVVLLCLTMLLYVSPYSFLGLLVIFLMMQNRYFNLLCAEGLVIWSFQFFLLEYGGIDNLLHFIDHQSLMMGFFVSLLHPVFPIFSGIQLLTWLHGSELNHRMTIINFSTIIIFGLFLYFYYKNFSLKK